MKIVLLLEGNELSRRFVKRAQALADQTGAPVSFSGSNMDFALAPRRIKAKAQLRCNGFRRHRWDLRTERCLRCGQSRTAWAKPLVELAKELPSHAA